MPAVSRDPTSDRVEERRAPGPGPERRHRRLRRAGSPTSGSGLRVGGIVWPGNLALAEELTQDAFLKAYRALGSFRGESRFSTWVYRITINLCRDHFDSPATRFRQRQASLDGPGLERFDPPADGVRPDEALETEEVARDFDAALHGLETTYKEAFLLRHQEGLPYDEISEVLEISVSNAKVRVHRARELILADAQGAGLRRIGRGPAGRNPAVSIRRIKRHHERRTGT